MVEKPALVGEVGPRLGVASIEPRWREEQRVLGKARGRWRATMERSTPAWRKRSNAAWTPRLRGSARSAWAKASAAKSIYTSTPSSRNCAWSGEPTRSHILDLAGAGHARLCRQGGDPRIEGVVGQEVGEQPPGRVGVHERCEL